MKFKNRNIFGKITYIILYPLRVLGLGVIWFYKFCISPMLPHSCRYTPTCSSYGIKAIKEYGIIKGSFMAAFRILRCNPWSKGGFDPVKDNIKGDLKWLI